jgi:L-fucose isomerase-like protein
MGPDRMLIVGELPLAYFAESEVTDDPGVMERTLGISSEVLGTEELVRRRRGLSGEELARASALADKLLRDAQDPPAPPPPRDELDKAVRLYVALAALVDEHRATAVTVNCGPFIGGEGMPVPCVALTLLQDAGVPAACQVDLDAAATMVLFHRASGRATCMGGLFERGGFALVSHCVMPRRMLGPDAPPLGYYLADYHGRKASPTIHAEVPAGTPVTLGRLTRGLQSLVLAAGTVRECGDLAGFCRNALLIEVPDVRGLMRRRVDRQYHFVAVCGDWTDRVAELADEAGIRVDRLPPAG